MVSDCPTFIDADIDGLQALCSKSIQTAVILLLARQSKMEESFTGERS